MQYFLLVVILLSGHLASCEDVPPAQPEGRTFGLIGQVADRFIDGLFGPSYVPVPYPYYSPGFSNPYGYRPTGFAGYPPYYGNDYYQHGHFSNGFGFRSNNDE